MKYLKTHEEYITHQVVQEQMEPESKYKVGDYVMLIDDHLWRVDKECIITTRYGNWNTDDNSKPEHIEYSYEIDTHNKEGEEVSFWVNEVEIEGKLTPEEIEKYKIKNDARKYNL